MDDLINFGIDYDGSRVSKGMAQLRALLENQKRHSAVNAAAIKQSLNSINNVQVRSNLLQGLTRELERSRRETDAALKQIKGSFESLPKPISSSRMAVISFAGSLAALGFTAVIAGIKEASSAFMGFSDQAGSIQAKLTLATQKMGDFATANRDVAQIANTTRADLGSVTDLYATMSRNADTLALSQKQVAVATQTVGMALKIGGQGAAQSSAAILQLSQAMGTGKLSGDEFASLAENAPRLMDLFASALGKPRGELKKLASEGKITSAVIAKALTDPKLVAAIQAEFAKIPVSFADIGTAAKNAGITMVGAFSQGASLGGGLRSALESIQEYVKANQQTFVEWGIRARYAFVALADAASSVWSILGPLLSTIADNLNLVATVLGAAVSGWAAYRTAVLVAAAANTPLIASIISTTTSLGLAAGAQVAFAAATGVASTAIRAFTVALLTNPLTIIATALAVVVGGVIAYTMATKDATKATESKMDAEIRASRVSARRAEMEAKVAGWNDKQRAAAIASIQANLNAAKAHLVAADAALKHALAEQAAAQAILRAKNATAGTTRGGGLTVAKANADKADADAKRAAEARKRAEEEVKGTQRALNDMQRMIARSTPPKISTPAPAPASTDKPAKSKAAEGLSDAEKAAKKYDEAIKNLNDRIKDLTLTEEQKALADELERAGLGRDITQINAKADAIRKLFKELKDGEKEKKVGEVIAEFNEKIRELSYSEEQLAMVEARRRAGLETDLSVTSEQTKRVDAQAQAYYRLQKAKESVKAVAEIEKDQKQRNEDIKNDDLARTNPDKAEDERRILQIERESEANIEKIRQLEGINEQKRQELILNEQNIAAARRHGVEMDRQAETARKLTDFLENLWENPKQAMRQFFKDLMKRLLEAILKSAILGEKLGGAGGIGGLLKSAIGGALGIGGGRASGGSVRTGDVRWVGENGPELMKFGAAGTIMNHNTAKKAVGAGGGANINIGGTSIVIQGGATPDAQAQMKAQLDAHRRAMISEIDARLAKKR